jgi:hypothetical protein
MGTLRKSHELLAGTIRLLRFIRKLAGTSNPSRSKPNKY